MNPIKQELRTLARRMLINNQRDDLLRVIHKFSAGSLFAIPEANYPQALAELRELTATGPIPQEPKA